MDVLVDILRPFGRFAIFIPLLAVLVKQSRGQKYVLCAVMFLFGALIWGVEGAMCLYMGLSGSYFTVGDPYRQMMVILGVLSEILTVAWVIRGIQELRSAAAEKNKKNN